MGEERRGRGGERERSELEKSVDEMERWWKIKEREERRKNIIVKGIEVKEGKIKEAVEKMLKKIRVEARFEQVKRIGAAKDRKMDMIVRLKDEEQKKESDA